MSARTSGLRSRNCGARLHVLDAVDGDASHAHVTLNAGVVGVVAAVRGKIEGDTAQRVTSRTGHNNPRTAGAGAAATNLRPCCPAARLRL